jgi:four helix bundle protein
MNWKDLKVWQKAHALALEIHKLTKDFSREEVYGLTSQLRRSASSVPANIVEGQSRNTTKEYLAFLYNARGSLEETRYHLLLSRDLGYVSGNEFGLLEAKCEEVSKMLNGLIQALRKNNP